MLTNVDPRSRDLIDFAYSYGDRQRIETAIRDVKNTFMGETDSAAPAVRAWFFLTGCLFYNIHEGITNVTPSELLPVNDSRLTGRELLYAARGTSFISGVNK